jgi:transposase InsO family protein
MRVCRSATSIEVIDALDQARRQYGLPTTIHVDQGSQFTSKELDLRAYANDITLDFSRAMSRFNTMFPWIANDISFPMCRSSYC